MEGGGGVLQTLSMPKIIWCFMELFNS